MYKLEELNSKKVAELKKIAEKLNIKKIDKLKKQELAYAILDYQAENNENNNKQKKPDNNLKQSNKQHNLRPKKDTRPNIKKSKEDSMSESKYKRKNNEYEKKQHTHTNKERDIKKDEKSNGNVSKYDTTLME